MNATSRMHAYLDRNSRRFEAWRDEHLSVPFSEREPEPEPERAEARTTSFPRAALDRRLSWVMTAGKTLQRKPGGRAKRS